jgi:hypothetical protein
MNLAPLPVAKFWDNNGQALVGGLLFTYEAGTSIKVTTYKDASGGSQNTNPIEMNFRGEANIWLDPTLAYKFVLSPPGDTDPPTNPIWTVDQIESGLTFTQLTQQFLGMIINPRTPAEIAAGVTPISYIYPSTPIMDPRRYHIVGTIGNATDDLASVNTGLSVLKGPGSRGGRMLIPTSYSASMSVPALNLSASQAVSIIDLRADAIDNFGAILEYVEARDASGGYASERRVQGKQNPAFVLRTVSDGTAPGFPIPNNATSIVSLANDGDNNTQFISDPLFRGYLGDFGFVQYAQGTNSGFVCIYAAVDANNKTRFDLDAGLLVTSTINITSVTNTTPVVVNLASPHGIAATRSQVSIAGVTANINGSWVASATGASQLTLLNSVASGAFGVVGTATVIPNSMRATVNVPAVQGGVEAILSEGIIVSTVALGTAPVSAVSQSADVNLHARPYVVNINGAQQTNGVSGSGGAKIVEGSVSLSGGTATVTLTGDAVFTGVGTYKVVATDATAAAAVQAVNVSASQFTLNGTGTDLITFLAVGF